MTGNFICNPCSSLTTRWRFMNRFLTRQNSYHMNHELVLVFDPTTKGDFNFTIYECTYEFCHEYVVEVVIRGGPCYNVIYIFTWTYLNNNFSQISTNKSTWKILGFWLWNDVSVSSLLTTYYFKYCEINNITWEKQVADGILGTLLWPNKIRFLYCLLF